MLRNYFKIAFRNLIRYKSYAFINTFGLALGIAVCLMILMFVNHELSYDQFHTKADRIYRANLEQSNEELAVTPSMIGPTLGRNLPEIENWVRIYEPTRYSPVIMTYGENNFQENAFFYADSSFFDIFTFQFIRGNPETALDQPNSVVITETTAQKLFGDANPVGEILEARVFSNVRNLEVTGVIKDVPKNSHFSFDYMASLSTRSGWSQLRDNEVRSSNFYTYFLLREPGASEALKEKISASIQNYVPEDYSFSIGIMPLTDIYLHSDVSYEIATMGSMYNILGFSVLAFLILLIAITNYINLATARSARRAPEVGIRKVLGAQKSALIRQFYGESVMITVLAVIIAILMVELVKAPFFRMLGKDMNLSLLSNPQTWLVLAVITLITAFLAGGYPALVLSSYQPGKVLKGIFSSTGSDAVLRKGLVVFQFAISMFLILGTVVIYQQTDFILTKNLGFDKDQVIILPAGDNILSEKHDLLKSEILRQPSVESATYMSNIPGHVFGGYVALHEPLDQRVNTAAGAADPDVVNTLGLSLLAGDGFPKNQSYSPESQGYVYLINETLASAFGWTPQEAIGKQLNVLGDRAGKVTGVIQDFNYASLKENIEPLALFIQPTMYDHLVVKISSQNVMGTLASIQTFWNDIAPHRPYEFQFLDQEIDALYTAEMQTKNMFTVFAVLAVIIACMGLLGLSSYIIEKRTKEIGVRKVLGASVSNIVQLLSSDFLKLVAFGFLIAAPAGWYFMSQWLQNFAYRIQISGWVFVITGGVAIVIAFAAVSWQSIRAALANPVDSLRSE